MLYFIKDFKNRTILKTLLFIYRTYILTNEFVHNRSQATRKLRSFIPHNQVGMCNLLILKVEITTITIKLTTEQNWNLSRYCP